MFNAAMFLTHHTVAEVVESPPQTLEEVDVARHREITSKAVSAILLLLLKWFKASRKSQGKSARLQFSPFDAVQISSNSNI